MTERATPETDACANGDLSIYPLARRLERERDEAREKLAACEKDAERYRWLRIRLEVRGQQALSGSVRSGISVRLGCAFFDTKCRKPEYQTAEKLDAAIDAARGK